MDHNLVINIIILLGIIFSIYYQKNKIDALKTEVQSSKNIIDEMKSYMDIIKIDEVKKYVAVKEETVKLEEQQKRKELVEEMNEAVKEALKIQQHNIVSLPDTIDLIFFCGTLIVGVDPEYREDMIKDSIKDETVKEILHLANKSFGNYQIKDGVTQLAFVKSMNKDKQSLINSYINDIDKINKKTT